MKEPTSHDDRQNDADPPQREQQDANASREHGDGNMRQQPSPEAIRRRHRRSAIVARALSSVMKLLHRCAYGRNKNLGVASPELFAMMQVIINDWRGRPPITKMGIERHSGLPRKNVARYLDELAKYGLVQKTDDDRYIVHPDFYADRLNARYFSHIEAIFAAAANELRKLK